MKLLCSGLIALLLASNAYWFYQFLKSDSGQSYRNQQVYELEQTQKQLMAFAPAVAKNANKDEVIAAAAKHTNQDIYTKNGCTWVGWLGLRFDETGILQSVSPAWAYGDDDPCFPTP